jgi:hypothetical protein
VRWSFHRIGAGPLPSRRPGRIWPAVPTARRRRRGARPSRAARPRSGSLPQGGSRLLHSGRTGLGARRDVFGAHVPEWHPRRLPLSVVEASKAPSRRSTVSRRAVVAGSRTATARRSMSAPSPSAVRRRAQVSPPSSARSARPALMSGSAFQRSAFPLQDQARPHASRANAFTSS